MLEGELSVYEVGSLTTKQENVRTITRFVFAFSACLRMRFRVMMKIYCLVHTLNVKSPRA